MQVKKSELVQILTALGFKDADTWSSKRLTDRLNSLHQSVDENQSCNDSDLDNTLDDIIGALEDGEPVELVDDAKKRKKDKKEKPAPEPEPVEEDLGEPDDDDEDEEEEDSNADVETVVAEKEKKPKKEKTPKKEKKEPAGKDSWGSRVGSAAASINAALLANETACSLDSLAEQTSLTKARIRDHLRVLKKKELILIDGNDITVNEK